MASLSSYQLRQNRTATALFSSSILCCPTLAVTDAVLVALYPNGLLQKLGKEICCCARWSHIGAEAPALAAAQSRDKKERE